MNLNKICINQGTIITPWDDIIKWSDIMSNVEAVDWLIWVNNNICHQFDTDNNTTIWVKVRIATSMLNKLTSLTHEQKIHIHNNLTNNINSEINLRLDAELPF